MTHICVGKLTIIGSDTVTCPPGRRQPIIWRNARMISIGPLGKKFSEILIENRILSFISGLDALNMPNCLWPKPRSFIIIPLSSTFQGLRIWLVLSWDIFVVCYRAFCEISKPNDMGLESSGNSADGASVKFQSDTTIVIPNLVAYCLLNRGPPYLWHDWFYSTSQKYSHVFVLFCLFSVLSPDWSWILGFTCPHPSLLHH